MKIRAYTKDNERLNERQSARVFFFTAPPSTHVRSLCVGEPDSRSTSRRFCNFRLLHSGLQGISERMAGEEHEHFRAGELAAHAFCDDAGRRAAQKEGHHRRKRQKVPGRPVHQCSHPVQHLQILPHRVGRGCAQILRDAACERSRHAAIVPRLEPVPF